MKLTIKDYYIIADLMQNGNICIEYNKGKYTLFVYFNIEISNRREASTGGWITTSAIIAIDDIECYDIYGAHVRCEVDENKLIKICERNILNS